MMVPSASGCKGDKFGAGKLLQHGCRALSRSAGCQNSASPEGTQGKSIFGLRAARMDGVRTMNTTYRLELDVNPRRRLGTIVEFWTLLVATALKDVTRTSVSPSMRRHLPQRLASVQSVWQVGTFRSSTRCFHRESPPDTHTQYTKNYLLTTSSVSAQQWTGIPNRDMCCRMNFPSVDLARLGAATTSSTLSLH